MENEPDILPPKPLLDRFYAWYIAKWWHPLIPLAILLSGWLLQATIFSYYIEMNEEISMFIDFLFILTFFVILFAAFIHFLRAKRWLDFFEFFSASIILVCVFLFLALQIAIAHGDYI
ncbi:MAG: hypothetical protein J5553_01630 [Verrucomicrobia bacterium]|nr:hypothetical protein [Verrucomicrobiota bacterium]